MRITLEKNAKNVELFKNMANTKNAAKCIEAREAFAALAGPVVQTIINQAPVISNLYRQFTYGEGEMPFLTLDAFFDVKEKNYIKVWAQQEAGGLASSAPSPISKLPVMTYELVSAVWFYLEQLRVANIDQVAKTLERMGAEVLVQQEVHAVNPLSMAIAQSQYNKGGTMTYQVIRSNTNNQVVPADYYKMMTLMSRVNSSWVGGTPESNVRAITHFVGSPEFLEQVRLMAFEPVNTVLRTTYPLAGPEAVRDEIYRSAGAPMFAGIEIIPVYEMGKGQPYNTIFSNYAGAINYPGFGGSGTAAFAPTTEQIVFGIDARQDFLVQLAQSDADTGATFNVMLDDQFIRRTEKIGYSGKIREGRVVLDARNCVGLIF